MLSVILPRSAEPTVIQMTQEQLQKELQEVNGSELLVTDSWGEGIAKCRTDFICLVEADCLVNSGYFGSMMGLFKKNPYYRQLGIMSSATGINNWANKIYGYHLGSNYSDGVMPNKESKSTSPYFLGVAFIPGAIIRMSTLKRVMQDFEYFESYANDLVYFSTMLSLEFLRKGSRISINPNATYVTTEDYVGEDAKFDASAGDIVTMFEKDYQNKNRIGELL